MADLIERDAVLAEIGEFQIRFNETGDSHERVAYASAEHCMLVIKAAPAVNRWIPCSERLPEKFEYVLCVGRDGMGILRYTGATWLDENAIAYTMNEITHWMPLPDLPKEDDDA